MNLVGGPGSLHSRGYPGPCSSLSAPFPRIVAVLSGSVFKAGVDRPNVRRKMAES